MNTLPPLPPELLPHDGRFGCGPSRIRPEQIDALRRPLIMGTSHRQEPVKNIVNSIRQGLTDLFSLPSGYEVALGNGGATAFWDMAAASLIRRRAHCAVFGEFGAKFAEEIRRAPHLVAPIVTEAPAGQLARISLDEDEADTPADTFVYPHHETSTGVVSPVYRCGNADALTLVDGTSIAGAMSVDLSQSDAYYFSPQKVFGSDGGLWVAILSPAALQRAEELNGATDRWIPKFLNVSSAVAQSRKNQTLNTPAIATLVMMDQQIQWMLAQGGLETMERRARQSSDLLYAWAESSSVAHPFVEAPELRSPVVVTIEFDEVVDAKAIASHLRRQGIVDINAYRGVGRNQLRIGTWPATDLEDVDALIGCLDFVLEHAL
ncbi:phosphoserine transaminase [Schaalia sp. ZJ405]|uniref:phosphoserine transaminase n=1 Tax=Schaalia sp. ZJ405 TaxID=2709403 RepID=UPI0013ECDC6B|nr:phosphoserine transaminase [Schaalia sp. ZJ405]QPK81023.1 phosphoserine transaminase [Schaalia sp. ZJ405]